MNERDNLKKGNSEKQAKIALIMSMIIFGTIGIFRKYIPLPSGMIALARGFIGMIFLLSVVKIKGSKISWKAIRENLVFLLLSGIALGFNWILLFEAYQYTSVAVATLCYYMAPIMVILVAPVFFKEKLTGKKILRVGIALVGMVLVSGVVGAGTSATDGGSFADLRGILLGLAAAVLYASVMLLNKKIKDISAYDKTIVQLGTAGIVLVPYTLFAEDVQAVVFSPIIVIMLLIVGALHTGVAYALYFGSMKDLRAQTVALYSYIDPIVAIVLSALVLREKVGIMEMVGACMVLFSTLEKGKK